MKIETEVSIYTRFGYLEDIPAVFDVEVECVPYQAGPAEVTARLKSLQFNGLTLTKDEVISWVGAYQVQHLETWVEETY